MHISFSPQRRDDTISVIKSADTLTINGEVFDFSVIPDGAELPAEAVASDFVVGPVARIGGVLHLMLALPHGPNPSPAAAFPVALIDPPNGPLPLPFDPPAQEVTADE